MSKSQPKQTAQKPAERALKPKTTPDVQTLEEAPLVEGPGHLGQASGLPRHPTSKRMRQAAILRMQRRQGNGYVQRFLHGEQLGQAARGQAGLWLQPENGDTPGEEQRATAQAAAQAAEGDAGQVASQAQQGASNAQPAADQEEQPASRPAAPQPAAPRTAGNQSGAEGANGPAGQSGPEVARPASGQQTGGPNASQESGVAPAGGGSAEHAPTSPQEDEGFLSIVEQIRQKAEGQKSHPPAQQEAQAAQEAAESPASETQSKANAGHVHEMESAQEPAVDKGGLKAQIMQKVQSLAPSTADEADRLKSSGKLGAIKAELQGKMAQEKDKSIGPLKEKSEAGPSQAGIAPKPVKPLQPPAPKPPMQQFNAGPAMPKPKPKSEVEKPLKQGSQSLDQQMAEAEITEEQLRRSNEPEFQGALDAKKMAQQNADEAPQQFRQAEQEQISQAREEANTSANDELQGMQEMHQEAQNQVGQDKGQAKSADEAKRQEVADKINGIFDKTRANVDRILSGLDAKVLSIFEAGASAAQAAFESFVAAKMAAYKQSRYGGVLGWARWAKDKLLGLPAEVNQFYVQGRERYLAQMDAVIDNVVSVISSTIAEAKSEVAQGKAEIQDYVNQLPAELQQVGQDAAAEIQGRFDELENQINQAQNELVDQLAQRYTENLQMIDARVEEMQAQNRGLLQAAADAIRGVVQTIAGLRQRLTSILSRVASAVSDIMRDPVGFLGNLLGAVKTGLMNFVGNIASHLQRGLISWLFKTLEGAGIELPDSFDMQGILSMVMRVLGLTWRSVRARLSGLFGERVMGVVENVSELFQTLKSEGIGGLFRFVRDQVTGIRDTVLDAVRQLVTSEIVQAGIQKMIGMLAGPANAFIRAVETIHDVVSWFIGNGQRIASLVQAIMSSITFIVSGSIGQATEFIERSLSRSIPAALGFLADLLGLGDISRKIMAIIQRVREPVDRVIDWLIDRARSAVVGLGGMLGGDESAEGAEGASGASEIE